MALAGMFTKTCRRMPEKGNGRLDKKCSPRIPEGNEITKTHTHEINDIQMFCPASRKQLIKKEGERKRQKDTHEKEKKGPCNERQGCRQAILELCLAKSKSLRAHILICAY